MRVLLGSRSIGDDRVTFETLTPIACIQGQHWLDGEVRRYYSVRIIGRISAHAECGSVRRREVGVNYISVIQCWTGGILVASEKRLPVRGTNLRE